MACFAGHRQIGCPNGGRVHRALHQGLALLGLTLTHARDDFIVRRHDDRVLTSHREELLGSYDDPRQRLHDATPEVLETWADRVLDAQRLEDVFGS